MSKNKLLLLLVLLLMAATGAMAQSTPITTVRSWDFTKGGRHSDWASAQAAATSVWGGPDSSFRYSNANNLSEEELTDGTNPLKGLAGIYFTAPAGSLLLGGKDSSSKCLQTSSDGVSILLVDCAAKDRITIRFCASVSSTTVTITSDQMKSSYVANSTDRSNEVSAFVKENGNVVLNVPSKVRIYEIKVEPYVAVTNFNLSAETVTVTENKTVTVTATGFSPSNAFDKTLEWTTADENVANVANGVITGVNPGTTTITVTSVDGPSKTIGVTVLPTYSVTLAEGTEDADKWTVKVGEGEAQAFPVKGLDGGETVIATYSGTKKVKSVKAVKKAAYAANEYNEGSWDGTKVVFTKQTAASVTAVANSAAGDTWDAGWYTVSGNVTITGNVTLTADTHLILQDGATLTINGKIDCNTNGKNLYIYGQKKGDGKLIVTNSNDNGLHGSASKFIEIHGGEITATTQYNAIYAKGIKVYGGKITATATGNSSGIVFGNGFDVYGGEIEATNTSTSMASHGFSNGFSAPLTVYGGKVTATGNANGSGFHCFVKSGTSGIKFYFSDNGTDWDAGTSYASATQVGYAAATKKRYAKAE